MSSASTIQLVTSSSSGPHASAQMQALNSLSSGTVSLWSVAFSSVSNFACEAAECTLASRPAGKQTQKLTFHVSKAADLITGLHLEVRCPKLTSTDSLITYVWGLGYAMISHASFLISNHSQEDLGGDVMELLDELHGVPGKRLTEAIFKYDDVTLPEMSVLSSQGPVLYIPIPFWFSKGTHAALPMLNLNCYDVDVTIQLRSIKEIYVALTDDCNPDTNATVVVDGTTEALDWSHFQFTLWANGVFLDSAERNSFASQNHQYLMKTVQSYTSYTADEGVPFSGRTLSLNNLSFQHPTAAMIFILADKNRRASYHKQHAANGTPFTAGVRALYGQMASITTGGGTTNGANVNADFNVLREGAVSLDTIQGTALTTITNNTCSLMSSAAVKTWRRDGLKSCLHLPGNRFDYRMTDSNGADIEPLDTFRLTLNSQDRVHNQLHASHYRLVQADAFHNIPRKGIYIYSFAKNASSPFVNGTINFSRIDAINVEFTKNSDVPADSALTDGGGVASELYLYTESYNVLKIGQNSVGVAFGS